MLRVPQAQPVLAVGTARVEPDPAAKPSGRGMDVGTPANFMGTFVGNNRTALVSMPLCWGLFTGLVLGTESVSSPAPAAAQHEHTTDCFPGLSFPTGKKKRSDSPSPQLQRGVVT